VTRQLVTRLTFGVSLFSMLIALSYCSGNNADGDILLQRLLFTVTLALVVLRLLRLLAAAALTALVLG
jgi:hypothetical protein